MKVFEIVWEVVDEIGILMVGNICNIIVYKRDDDDVINKVWNMFKVKLVYYCIGNLFKIVEIQVCSINFVRGGGVGGGYIYLKNFDM